MAETLIQKTYEEIAEFDGQARRWLSRNGKNTKFKYAVERMLKRTQKVIADYQERVDEISIKNAATDEQGVILTDDRGAYRFKADGMLKAKQERSKLFRSQTQIEPYYAPDPPQEMPANEADIFMDFVLRERPAEPEEKKPETT